MGLLAAREHWTEGKVHYRFHPRCGEMVAMYVKDNIAV